MAGILNAQYASVFTSEDSTNMPEAEVLFTGEDINKTEYNIFFFLNQRVLTQLNTTQFSGFRSNKIL